MSATKFMPRGQSLNAPRRAGAGALIVRPMPGAALEHQGSHFVVTLDYYAAGFSYSVKPSFSLADCARSLLSWPSAKALMAISMSRTAMS